MKETAWGRNKRISRARGAKKAADNAKRYGTIDPAADRRAITERQAKRDRGATT